MTDFVTFDTNLVIQTLQHAYIFVTTNKTELQLFDMNEEIIPKAFKLAYETIKELCIQLLSKGNVVIICCGINEEAPEKGKSYHARINEDRFFKPLANMLDKVYKTQLLPGRCKIAKFMNFLEYYLSINHFNDYNIGFLAPLIDSAIVKELQPIYKHIYSITDDTFGDKDVDHILEAHIIAERIGTTVKSNTIWTMDSDYRALQHSDYPFTNFNIQHYIVFHGNKNDKSFKIVPTDCVEPKNKAPFEKQLERLFKKLNDVVDSKLDEDMQDLQRLHYVNCFTNTRYYDRIKIEKFDITREDFTVPYERILDKLQKAMVKFHKPDIAYLKNEILKLLPRVEVRFDPTRWILAIKGYKVGTSLGQFISNCVDFNLISFTEDQLLDNYIKPILQRCEESIIELPAD